MTKLRHKDYQIQWQDAGDCWEMELKVKKSHSHTKYFDGTFNLLKNHLPCILECECENSEHLPFSEEVKQTEIGHLLEHILLEYLCQGKLLGGSNSAEFTGRTYWNIHQTEDAAFHIVIQKEHEDSELFIEALQKSLLLLERIFAGGSSYLVSSHYEIPQTHFHSQHLDSFATVVPNRATTF